MPCLSTRSLGTGPRPLSLCTHVLMVQPAGAPLPRLSLVLGATQTAGTRTQDPSPWPSPIPLPGSGSPSLPCWWTRAPGGRWKPMRGKRTSSGTCKIKEMNEGPSPQTLGTQRMRTPAPRSPPFLYCISSIDQVRTPAHSPSTSMPTRPSPARQPQLQGIKPKQR